jgi:predicted permease
MRAIGFELKQAARRVFTWKQTGAVLIPAIGLALATIMFAVGWSYSSLSLPFKDADRLVLVGYVLVPGGNFTFSSSGSSEQRPSLSGDIQPFFDWKERRDVFTDVAATQRHAAGSGGNLTVKTPNGNAELELSDATVNFFDVLGVSFPGIQAWKAAVDSHNPVPVALPHKIGVKNFDHPEIGRTFQTHDGVGIVVNGILPANFVPPDGHRDVSGIVPFDPKRGNATPSMQSEGMWISYSMDVIGRLAPGVTPQLAEQMLASGSGGERTAGGPLGMFGGKERLAIRPVTDIIAKSSRPVVWGACALGALILLLCTANLGGILLARCVFRLREYAMRSALGARFSDLLLMMLMELFLLSAVAAFIAAYITRIAMPAIAERLPIKSAAFGLPVFGWETALFLMTATLFVAAASGLFAAVALAVNYYKGFSQGIFAVFHSHRIPRVLLTVSQTAIATILLCLSWMTVRGYLDIYFRDPGVDTGVRIVEANVSPRMPVSAFNNFALDTIEAMRGGDPNMRIGVFKGSVLKGGSGSVSISLLSPDGTPLRGLNAMEISPWLLRTLKVEILAGRDFTEQDRDDTLLINESLSRLMGWPVSEAVGKQFRTMGSMDGGIRVRTVIGVVRDFPTTALDGEVSPMYFNAIYRRQMTGMYSGRTTFSFVIHPDAMSRVGNIEQMILRFDPETVIARNAKWGEMLGASVRGRTFATFSVTLFTIAAIAIVITGIVSTITFIITRRTRDIAIQIAIGAPSFRVCWFVMKDMVIAGISGALIGGIASWWAGKAVAHYIYNGEKYQNLTGLAVAAAVMLVIIAAAALLPALRVLRIEPGRALNME